MCCLFGIHDYGHNLTRKQRSTVLSVLSVTCEERGTDATGIAYNAADKLCIYKRPLPARFMWFRVPEKSNVIMGHTRMTTQGSEYRNHNNHPFLGQAGTEAFALAHNGVLQNDMQLRKDMQLPATKIETDSYIAVYDLILPSPKGLMVRTVVTGEDTGGSHSSLLRCLVLSISKGDIEGNKLRRYQDNPLLMMTHMRHFLTWCGEKGHCLVNYIRERFEAERQFFQSMFKELRLVDTAATLMVTARILGLYGEACGALQDGTMNVMVRTCCDAVMQAVSYSESFSKELNPTCMYLRAFFDLWDNGGLLIAPDLNSYVAGKMIGYGDGDTVWLHHRELHAKVKKYWQRFDVLFPLSPEKTAEHLADAGLIEVSYETRDGGTKRLFSKKSSLPSRPRLMVLNAVLARQYLERETE